MIAEVIIQSNVKNLDKTFDYHVPMDLEEKITVGSRVFVPFGRMKKLEVGFVIHLKEDSPYAIKDIAKVEEEDVLDEQRINLGMWMANRYFCNLSDCLKLMLPPGTTTKNITNRAKEKKANFVILKKTSEEIEEAIETQAIKSPKQIRTLKFLLENGEVLSTELELFADTTRSVIQTLCKNGYIEIIEKQVERNPFINKNIERNEKLVLNKEQQLAYNEIAEAMDDSLHSAFLIHGVTGSRKNGSIFTINRKSFSRRKNKYFIST